MTKNKNIRLLLVGSDKVQDGHEEQSLQVPCVKMKTNVDQGQTIK